MGEDEGVSVELSLLGPFGLTVGGRPLPRPLPAKAQALLAYLALTGVPQSRHTLAGLLWGDAPEHKAKNSLRVTLAALRKALPDLLDVTHTTVALNRERVKLDADRLATVVAAGEPAALDAVLTLYRGPLLDTLFVDNAPEFEAWLLAQRAAWADRARAALERLAARQLDRRDYPAAVQTLQRALAIDPWLETAHRGLMRALSYQGDFNGALAQFETCRRVLADELDVTPEAETLALVERIQAARETPPRSLPQPATPLVGRRAELDRLLARFRDPGSRLVTLVGLGGSGKTRLALEAAHYASREHALLFLNGVAFVSLTAVATADLLPQALAAALDLPLAGPRHVADQLLNYLSDKEMLLVLDNFEHLLAAHPFITRLVDHCPDVTLLITSREPLQVGAEWRLDITGLPWPDADDEAPEASDAVRLFAQAARQVRPRFTVDQDTLPHAAAICRLAGGMPLALQLAAAWLRAMPLAQVATELRGSFDLLSSTRRDIPERQRSVRAVLDATWERLTNVEQETFAALSLFAGGFSAGAAAAVVGAPPAVLAGLVDRALLTLAGDGRYHIHELARQYGAKKLALTPERQARLRQAHAAYYADRLHALTPDLITIRQKEVYAAMQANIGNIREAWAFAVMERDAGLLDQMADPLWRFTLRQGWFAEGETLFRQAIDALAADAAADELSQRVLSRCYGRLGGLLARIGDPEAAMAALDEALLLAQRVEEAEIINFALIERGNLLRDQSRPAEARRHYEEALAVARESGDQHSIALALDRLGSIIWDFGDHKTALERLAESLEILRGLGNIRAVARSLNSLGNVTMSMSDNAAAERHYLEALSIAEELDERYLLDTLHINLGMLYNNLGQLDRARHHYERSLSICRRIGDEIGRAYCFTGLGQVAHNEGDLATARALFERSLAMNERFGRQRYIAINLNMLGHVARDSGDIDAAWRRYEASMAIFRRIDHEWGMATSHVLLGETAWVRGEYDVAGDHFRQALHLAYHNHILGRVYQVLVLLARDLQRRGERQKAAALLYFVQAQSAVSPALRQEAESLAAEVTAGWPEQEVTAVRESAVATSLDDIVAPWLPEAAEATAGPDAG